MPEQFLFTKEKGSLFNVKVWMKLLVKKNTPCYGNQNRNGNNQFICSVTYKLKLNSGDKFKMKEISMRNFDYITNPAKLLTPEIVQMVGSIHEHKGKQELFREPLPVHTFHMYCLHVVFLLNVFLILLFYIQARRKVLLLFSALPQVS